MKKSLIVIPLVFLFCIAFSCQEAEEVSVEPSVDVEADILAIKDIVKDFEAAVNTADIERYLQLYADDVIDIYPNMPALSGKEAIRNRDQQLFEKVTLQDVYTVQNVKVSGDLAVAHVTLSAVITIKASGETSETNGNWIMVFEKQSDSAWKVIYSIWSDEGLVRPTQATVATAQSPFIGSWKLNLDKSKFIGSAPLEWTDVYGEIEGDQYEVTTKIALADGTIMNEVIVWPRQGGVARYLQGGTEGVIWVGTMISPNEWIFTPMVDGKQTGLMNCLVSQNGKTMRYTLRFPGTMEGEAVFDKQ